MSRHCKCPHLENVLQLSLSELCKLKQGHPCSKCDTSGPNLWICLYKNCLHTGCSEQYRDHSTKHFKTNQNHCVHMNLSSQRIWCYLCETEVFIANNRRSSIVSNDSSDASRLSEKVVIYDRGGGESCDSSGDEDDGDRRNYGGGLIGLQNIANTCYMNAALQALSNTPPLTGYFLDCGDIIEATNDIMSQQSSQRKTGLARSYHRLVKDMWCRNKRSNGYVVPTGILNGIRNVHPMFRGYQQHDTQEFLRCFMDQLHEELKEITPPPPDVLLKNNAGKLMNHNDNIALLLNNNLQLETEEDRSQCSSPSLSQSEAEYETCDSGVSEQSSLSDEGPAHQQIIHHRFSRSPSPTSISNQRHKSHQPSLNKNRSNSSTSINSAKSQKEVPKPPHRSIISDVFDGKLLSSVQCLTCDRVSTREETFQDLSLPIPGKDHLTVLHQSQGALAQPTGVTCTDAVYQVTQDGWFWWLWNWFRSFFWGPAVSLHDCMAAFFSADELKGDNMYSCEKCNKLRNGMKFSRVLELPEMLCVHLKRFRHDLSYSSKIASPVLFPLKGLDMSTYLHKDCKSEISTYDLTAVICHHGTVGGGHYTSFAKHELNGKWYEYDDQLVTEVSEEMVQCCEAYVLFYRKSNPQMSLIRAQASQLSDITAEQAAADIRFYISKQWLNKFNTFAEPGPIDNWALLCPHGALSPCKAPIKSQLVVPLPQPLWDFLYKKFGGGPACNHLYDCDICRRAAESLSRRQTAELEAFQIYKDEMTATIYAISMAWLRQWQLFIGGATTDEPGPINNTAIAGHAEFGMPIRTVRLGSDYAQISSSLWLFFHGIYGGGPDIILRGTVPDEIKEQKLRKDADTINMDENPIVSAPIASKTTSKIQVAPERIDTIREVETTEVICENGINPSPPIQKKIVKNVSFENDENHVEHDNSSNSSHLVTEPSIFNAKRSKHHHSTSKINTTTNEIVSKRDKRHRSSITTNELFGPEGKYSDFTQHTNIPDEIPNSFPHSPHINSVSPYINSVSPYIFSVSPHINSVSQQIPIATIIAKVNTASSNSETTKKADEITPLLNQTTIAAVFMEPKSMGSTSEFLSRNSHVKKNTYRKKMKTRSSRKAIAAAACNTANNPEVSLSDSDRN